MTYSQVQQCDDDTPGDNLEIIRETGQRHGDYHQTYCTCVAGRCLVCVKRQAEGFGPGILETKVMVAPNSQDCASEIIPTITPGKQAGG